MEFKFWKWTWNGTVEKVLPSRKEVLDNFVSDKVKEITTATHSGKFLSNQEVGYVTIELKAAIKKILEERQEILEKDLHETVQVLNIM